MAVLKRWALILLGGLVAGGCATINPDLAREFGAGVATARQQSVAAFAAVNGLTSKAVLEHGASRSTLDEKNFFSVLDPKDISKWERVFRSIEDYAAHLAALTDPKAAQGVSDALVELGGQLKAVAPQAAPSPGIATAFTKLAEVLLRGKAQRKAREVALATDPAMAELFKAMGETIGGTPEEGIRGTALSNWRLLMAEKQVAFLALARDDGPNPSADRKNMPQRRVLASEFADLLARRDAQDAVLQSLGQSFLALSRAHNALAAGSAFDVTQAVALVKDEARSTRALHERFAGTGSSKEGP
jgi:hypothetical protein